MKFLQEYIIERLSGRIDDITSGNGYISEDIDLAQIITDHSTFTQVLRRLGVDTDRLSTIGSGGRGTAFTDGKLVVKVTSDIAEAYASQHIIGMRLPGVVQIHYVAALAKPQAGEHLYVIIQDLVSTKLNRIERVVADNIGDFLSTNKNWPFPLDQTSRAIFHHVYRRTNQNLYSPSTVAMVRQILQAVLALYENGVKYFDVSGDNVGKDNSGNYLIFDLGISITRKANLPLIEELLFDDRKLILLS